MAKEPGHSKTSSANVQRDIREVMGDISRKTRKHAELRSSHSKAANVSDSTTVAGTSKAADIPHEERLILKNAYAREWFFRYTNVTELIAAKYPNRSERTRRAIAKQYYSSYARYPKLRIRESLEEIRFVSRYHEGLFRMALKPEFINADDHRMYIRNLSIYGLKKLCFVDMTRNNCVLEYQAKTIRTLKAGFQHWGAKLEKLSKYLIMYQRKREAYDQKFLFLLQHHSCIKGSHILELPDVVEQLVSEARLPSEKRKNALWLQLTFDDDRINKKYETGVYAKSPSDIHIDPVKVIDNGSLPHIRTPSQVLQLPDSMSFTPFACSTQTQTETFKRPIVNSPVASSSTQDLDRSGKFTGTSYTRVPSMSNCRIKEEIPSQHLSLDEDDVEIIPNQDYAIAVDDSVSSERMMNCSDFRTSIDSINARVLKILARNENPLEMTINQNEDVNLACAEGRTSNSSLQGRLNRPTKAEQSPISAPRIGTYITIAARRNRKRETLFATTTTRPNHSNSYMVFLSVIDIQSIRYTNIPTTWPQCNIFQQNQLTCNLNPGSAGLFSVPIRDHQACLLLGLSAGGKGREALLAALAHVGKFRYGPKEPAKEYYRLSVTEKVLHLFFATFPPCPQNGGFVMFPKSKSSVPANGDEVWLERFNYYAHTKPQSVRSCEEPVVGNTYSGEPLANLLLPGIAQKMKTLREQLMAAIG